MQSSFAIVSSKNNRFFIRTLGGKVKKNGRIIAVLAKGRKIKWQEIEK
ncbi:lipooligosaccharide galactosyltransferase II domain protein [Haemophilus influenzae]|nr:lipooligosaccharide galactosyltransferase II domain protein [Haemophilus influenzae]AVJ01111.1 lipooligosaccharide galactosyltransferase II domain protein [Haemophilus influenzae]